MIYIESPSNDPYFNLALEQYVFDNMSKDNEYFMLWQNDNAVIVGKHQNTIAEINQEYVKEKNISVVRRLSGGGAVYHDLGNLNFTFIVDDTDIKKFDFSKFCNPIVKSLKKLDVEAEINGRNDITIDGKKFSGNSQYTKRKRIMHHGTILYNSNIDVVSSALKVSKDKIESKGVKSVKSRITNVKDYINKDIPIEEFKKLLVEYMFENGDINEYKLTYKDFLEIDAIKKNRYDTWEWNYGTSPRYNILKERRFEGCGKLEVYMDIQGGIIKSCYIHGDYFGNGDSKDIANKIIGCKLKFNEIYEAISDINIGDYFNKLASNDFVNLITS